MTQNHPATPLDGEAEHAAAEELANQKQAVGKLYRLKEILSGLIALAEDGSISAGQIRAGLQKAFSKAFPRQ